MDAANWVVQNVSGVLQNVVAAGLGYFLRFLQEWRRKRRMLNQVGKLAPGRSQREAVLILGCREDIEVAVRAEIKNLNLAVDDKRILKVYHSGAFHDDEGEWMAYAKRVRSAAQQLRSDGRSRVHLFTNVPVAMAVFAGALLDNGPELVVYHYFNGVYRRVGALAFETVHSA